MVKFVFFLKCGDEYYVLLILLVNKLFKKKNVVLSLIEIGFLNICDDIWRKFFDLE